MSLSAYLARRGAAIDLARRLHVSHTSVARWSSNRIPAERVRAVSDATGIPAHDLRPDIFPPPVSEADDAAAHTLPANHDAAREVAR
jgi:DNA-binding transcriptional regulator YdaS (Cro superfamily)